MNRILKNVLVLNTLLAALPAGHALAHAVCGNRVFPATLIMDDPGVGNELSFPTVTYLPIPATNGNSAGHSVDYAAEWDKTITEDLGIAINGDYFTQRGASGDLNGWDNLSVTLKNELPCLESHELLVSVGVIRNFGGTGSQQLINAGTISKVSTTQPTLYLGKGLGDLPIGYLRPLALTGEVGYQFSDSPSALPSQWAYSASLQYSMPYLQQHVKALDIPAFFGRLVPIVETSFITPPHAPTTGTIAPGLFYESTTWQLGAEALFPATRASQQLQGTGFIVQFHLFLDDALPNSLGAPLIRTRLWQ